MPTKLKLRAGSEDDVLKYHRNNLYGGTSLVHDDGSKTTFMGAIVETPDGGQALIPTYWAGAVRSIPDAVRFAMKSGYDFPVYDTVEEAEAAEQRLHDIMEQDMQSFDAADKPQHY